MCVRFSDSEQWGSPVKPPRSQNYVKAHDVLTSPKPLSTLPQRFACARLSQPCLQGSCPDGSATLTTTPFDRSSLWRLEIGTWLPNSKGPPSALGHVVSSHSDLRA